MRLWTDALAICYGQQPFPETHPLDRRFDRNRLAKGRNDLVDRLVFNPVSQISDYRWIGSSTITIRRPRTSR